MKSCLKLYGVTRHNELTKLSEIKIWWVYHQIFFENHMMQALRTHSQWKQKNLPKEIMPDDSLAKRGVTAPSMNSSPLD